MDFKLKIESICSGKVEMCASCDGRNFPMKVSCNSDPCGEFCDMLVKLDDLCSSDDDFSDIPEQGLYLFWEGDNSQYTLKFTPLGNRIVKVEISLCEDVKAGIHMKDFPSISGQVPLDELIRAAYQDLLSLLRSLGFQGYRKELQRGCFPICYFLQLHNMANGGKDKPSGFASELAILAKISSVESGVTYRK